MWRFFSLLVLLIAGCNSKYRMYRSAYEFSSHDGRPDYAQLNYWAAHPAKWDPSDSLPMPLKNEVLDSTVDVFFLHPTTYTRKKRGINAEIDDPLINAKTDYSTILYQASVFNKDCRVFAPRYRQTHISSFFKKDSKEIKESFDTAYADIRRSFQYYLEHENKGRPIIIASHSQGSLLAEKLLKEFFDGKRLQNKLVVAYVWGWPIPTDLYSSLKMCEDSLQTGCLCGWRTLRRGYLPSYLKRKLNNSSVTNPLTWKTDDQYASRKLNMGSVLRNFNKIYLHTTDAQLKDGLLFVHKPKFPGSFFYLSRNYHIGDINLYYINIRQNITRRIGMFWKQ